MAHLVLSLPDTSAAMITKESFWSHLNTAAQGGSHVKLAPPGAVSLNDSTSERQPLTRFCSSSKCVTSCTCRSSNQNCQQRQVTDAVN